MENNLSDKQLRQLALEREWLDAEMAADPAWAALPNIHRFYAVAGRAYVIWRQSDSSPEVLEVYSVINFYADPDNGLTVWLRPHFGAKDLRVSPRPRQVFPGLYLWVPGHADVRFTPLHHDEPLSRRRLSVPFCARTACSSHAPLVHGQVYIAERKEFRKMFPNKDI